MAGKDRNQKLDLELLAILTQEPYRFGFFEALRQLECLHADRPRLGQSMRPADDAIRLGQTPSMQFAPSTLSAFELSTLKPLNSGGQNTEPGNTDNGSISPARLSVYFFGLFGPNGPLPLHLTEFARNRVRNARDSALVDFTNLFHHRLLSLFYRAWANKEPTVQLDRPEQDRFSFYVGSLLGIGEHSLQQRDAMPDHSKLHFTAHLGCHTRHAEGMKSILGEFLQVPVNIQEFIGEWLDMPDDSYCYLNQDTTGGLGQSAVIGTRSWQCQHKFRIEIGPVSLHDYRKLLPGSNSLKALVDIVKNYTGLEFNWDINLVLNKQDVPPARLGEYGQLGWTSWLENENRKSDANDLYLYMENIA